MSIGKKLEDEHKPDNHFIAKAIPKSHKGALHRALHIPGSQPIPPAVLASAAKRKGKVGDEARFAEELEKFHHKTKGGK